MSTEMTPAMRRSVLIATLRDKSMWPEGFVWDYRGRCTCAIGLLEKQLGRDFYVSSWGGFWEIGLSGAQAMDVFFNGQLGGGSGVTPEMVADRLEGMHNAIQARASTAS